MGSNVRVETAPYSGYCYGVERAIKTALEVLKEGGKVVSLGPLIHNPGVVRELESYGLRVVESIEEIEAGTRVIIRSHGVPPDTMDALKRKGVEIIDATCPYVRRAQIAARQLKEEGYRVVIVGEKNHPEVIGIKGFAGENPIVVETKDEALSFKAVKKMGVVFQTTQSMEVIDEIVPELVKKAFEVKLFNTICAATTNRQQATREVAARNDVVIVVGGKNSGNTRRLYEIAKRINEKTYHIEKAGEIDPEWLRNAGSVGITAGASTPREDIVEVEKRVKEIVAHS